MHPAKIFHRCSGNARAFVRTAAPLKLHPLCILLLLIIALQAAPGFAAQTASSQKSQAEINEEAQAAYRAGIGAVTNNDFKTAEAQFEKVVRLVPQIEEGHSALGAVLVRLGNYPQAIKELEKARSLKPGDVSVLTNLASAYEQTGANTKAIVMFKEVEAEAEQKAAPDSSQTLPSSVLAAYARALAATGQITEATDKMKLAIKESPKSADLHDALGSLYAQQQSWPGAISEFQEAIQLNPRLSAPHLHLGAALLTQQQVSMAIPELTKASDLAPDSAIAATELGKAYAANREDDKAIQQFQRAIKLDSRSTEPKHQLALALQRTGHDADAIPLLRQIVAAEPKNAPANASLGFALLRAGNAKDAIPFLERGLEQHPKDPTAHENLAAAYLEMGQNDEAIQVLRTGLKSNPKDFELHYNLGLALKLKDDNAGAIPELETAAKLDPSSHAPHYTLGVL